MSSNRLQIGDRVRYDRNDKSKEGTVKTFVTTTGIAEVEHDNEPGVLHSYRSHDLGIILTHGVSRNAEEHELVMSGLHAAMERIRALSPQIDRLIVASGVGSGHALMTAFGFVLPKPLRDAVGTALFASTFVDTLKDHKQIDPKTRFALSVLIEAVRLIARSLNVK